MSAEAIAKRVEDLGTHCERKSVYPYIDSLKDFGFDIVRSRKGSYFRSRLFEESEIQLLIDAVKSSKTITPSQTQQLINTILALTNKYEATKIRTSNYVGSQSKTPNENVYFNIDGIQEAIIRDRKISFTYMIWDADKKLVPKADGNRYVISPWCLIWESGRYYMAGYDEKVDLIKHYRVDKMNNVTIDKTKREGADKYNLINESNYKNFGMFGGKLETVTLVADADCAGAIIDHFGDGVWLHKCEDKINCVVDVCISPRFFAWVASFNGQMNIASPSWVLDEYKKMLMKCLGEE